VAELAEQVPVTTACEALGYPRSTFYRSRRPAPAQVQESPPAPPPRSLTPDEKATIEMCSTANDSRTALLARSTLLCWTKGSICVTGAPCIVSWMSTVKCENGVTSYDIRSTPSQNCWPPHRIRCGTQRVPRDITRLKGPVTWTYYYLYVILDIFSRFAVGWLLAQRESEELARHLMAETCHKQRIKKEQLTLHADRGSPMIAKSMGQLLIDLGVDQSHSRPHTSNDNPFSEAQFRTMKYRPDYPERFGSLPDAQVWARSFFEWYNNEHRHTGLALMTPAMVHDGLSDQVTEKRQQVLQAAYQAHPERFVKGAPIPPQLPEKVWINPPKSHSRDELDLSPVTPAIPVLIEPPPGAEVGSRVSGSESSRPLTPSSTAPQSPAAGMADSTNSIRH
jgi:putative transposase